MLVQINLHICLFNLYRQNPVFNGWSGFLREVFCPSLKDYKHLFINMPLHSHPEWIACHLEKDCVRKLICNLGKMCAKWLSVSVGKSLVNFQQSISHLGHLALQVKRTDKASTYDVTVQCHSIYLPSKDKLSVTGKGRHGSIIGLCLSCWKLLRSSARSFIRPHPWQPWGEGEVQPRVGPSSVPGKWQADTQGLQGCIHRAVQGWHQPYSRLMDRCAQSVSLGKELQHFVLV